MKWLLLLVILLVIVLVFGLWRRTQKAVGGAVEVDQNPPRRSAALPGSPSLPTTGGIPSVFDAAAPPPMVNVDPGEPAAEPAAEKSADEVGWAPATERPATPDRAEPIPSSQDDNWWQDEDNPRRDDPPANT